MNFARKIEPIQWLEILEKYRTLNESDREFAKRIGLNHGILGGWRHGKLPKVETINKIRDKIGIDDKDYSYILWLCYGILTAGDSATKRKIVEEMLTPTNLQEDHICALLLSKKAKNKKIREFITELGLSVDRWMELIQQKEPRYTRNELKKILTHPKIENDIDLFLRILGIGNE